MLTDLEIKAFVENFFFTIGFKRGLKQGERLAKLEMIRDVKFNNVSIDKSAAVLRMTPMQMQKWWVWFDKMQEGEANGLTPAEIVAQINELAAEPIVAEWEVTALLAYFKEQPTPKTKKRRTKKES